MGCHSLLYRFVDDILQCLVCPDLWGASQIETCQRRYLVRTAAQGGQRESGIYGNAIGPVICNAALIAATTIAVLPGKVNPRILRVPIAFFFVAAVIYCVAAYGMGEYTRLMGFIMLVVFIVYMAANVLQIKKAPAEQDEKEAELMPMAKTLLLLVIGAALIAVGADLLVDNGTLIAQALGVPESVIALTFVALGTSLPELVTAISSLVKGHSDLSLGNIIGEFTM